MASRLSAVPAFRESGFVLLSATATPCIAFNRVRGFSFTEYRNQFHRPAVLRIVHHPHRWTSIRGDGNFAPDSIQELTANFRLYIFSFQESLQQMRIGRIFCYIDFLQSSSFLGQGERPPSDS